MPDYKEMYVTLFQSATRAISILQEAQQATEQMYISSEYPDIRVPDINSPKPENGMKNIEDSAKNQ